jgi:glycosyltransferase involved in cell wall biosynthesis
MTHDKISLMKETCKTLYLCYFGLREPLVQTQVLPYLRELQKNGVKIFLLTFEPNFKTDWTVEEVETEKRKLADENINWFALPYHKRPSAPATLYDVLCGARFAAKLIRREKIDVLHARVHTPAMMGAIAKKFSGGKVKLLFDIRGFFPEEYTDGGVWKENGRLYKVVKRIEKSLLKQSDAFVVLTEKAREIMFPESAETGFDKFGRPVEVIPCCVDLTRFAAVGEMSRSEIREQYNLQNKQVVIYIGSLGSWYLADEMADLMQAAREQNSSTFAMILTQSAPEIMAERLKARGFSDTDFFVKKVPHLEIPEYLSAADIAVSFIKPCYSKLSSSPTKIAEYLASGVPIITNRGVGDVAEQIEADKTGAVVDDFSRLSYLKSLLEVEILRKTTDLAENCRQSARTRFDLEKTGGAKYRLLYKKLFGSDL